MQCSVEISLYPIRDHYLEPIESFIENLRAVPDIDVEVNAMSTQVYGDFTVVMAALTATMGPALTQLPGAFVLKVLGIDARAPHPRPA